MTRVRLQVLAFLVVSIVGVAYVGLRYVGLVDRSYPVHVELATSGGIFPNAPVTYRGVPVGRVRAVRLVDDGVRVELRLDRGTKVPTALTAVVAQRSAVGEQYLDLRPDTDSGPFLRPGDVIPRDRTGTPLPVEALLVNLDALVRSVGVDDLAVVIDELGTAFEGNETALRRLLDANSVLLADANRRLPETLALLRDSRTVLSTQLDSAGAIRTWAAALARVAATLRAADPDLRRLLANGPPAAAELTALLHGLEPAVGTLLGNLVSVNGIAARRLAGIEQILVVYPLVVAGGFTVAPGDGTAHLGLVVNINDPASCNYVQSGQQRRCTAQERARGSSVRGADSAPRPGVGRAPAAPGSGLDAPVGPTPAPTEAVASPLVAGYDPGTGLVIGPDGRPLQFGGTGGQARLAGAQSWKQLLLAGVMP